MLREDIEKFIKENVGSEELFDIDLKKEYGCLGNPIKECKLQEQRQNELIITIPSHSEPIEEFQIEIEDILSIRVSKPPEEAITPEQMENYLKLFN